MGKGKGKKQEAAVSGPDDPKILFNNYVQACKAVGAIEPCPRLKGYLTNEENPNRGVQLIIVGDDTSQLGPGGTRALVNAMIGKFDPSSERSQMPFTATKEIRICRSNIKDGGAAAIASLLCATANKRSMIISAEDGSAIEPDWKLEYLELLDNGIGRDGALALGKSLAIGMNTTLSTLILDFNRTIGSDGVEALCKGLSTNSTLQNLSLKHCGLCRLSGRPIGKMLLFKKTGLISLDLTCNEINGVGLGELCAGLMENTILKAFRLADNGVDQTDDDLQALELFSDVLLKHPALIAVDLLHNRIGTCGGSKLLPGLRENKQIQTFKVDSNMDEEMYKSLSRLITFSSKAKKKKKPKKK